MAAFILILVFAVIAIAAWQTRGWLPFARLKKPPEFQDAPFAIERATGAIHVRNSRLVLRRALPKMDFLESDLYGCVSKSRLFPLANGVGQAFTVSWQDPEFKRVYLWLAFENDRLGWVNFGWGPPITTAEWTAERIESEVVRYRDFMTQQLGSIRTFPWGTAHAGRDDKAGAPTMGVRYDGFDFRAA